MAKSFGIVPKHILEIPLESLTPEEFLVVGLETALACGWQITFISGSGFKAHTAATLLSSGEEITLHVHEEAASLSSESKGRQLFNTTKNKKNTGLFFSLFTRMKESMNKIAIHYKYEEWRQKFPEGEESVTFSPDKQRARGGFDLLKVFVPVEGYFVTPVLVAVNTLIFILMCCAGANILWPDSAIVLKWGADFKPYTLNGEWWRMITANFLHFGIIHLFFNMNALVYIGIALEPLLGKFKFLLAYMLTGITCNLASLWWQDNAIAAGASGSIFGMYGVFLALLTTNFIEKENRMATLKSIGFFVVFNLVFGAALGADNAGHIGGLLGGLLLGYCFYFTLMRPQSKIFRAVLLSLCTAGILALAVFMYNTLPNPVGSYLEKMEVFDRNEQKAIAAYTFEATPQGIRNTAEGLRLWQNNLAVSEEIKHLDLPAKLQTRNSLLNDYCRARIKFYELALEELQRPSAAHAALFEQYNAEIGAIVNKVKALDKQ